MFVRSLGKTAKTAIFNVHGDGGLRVRVTYQVYVNKLSIIQCFPSCILIIILIMAASAVLPGPY